MLHQSSHQLAGGMIFLSKPIRKRLDTRYILSYSVPQECFCNCDMCTDLFRQLSLFFMVVNNYLLEIIDIFHLYDKMINDFSTVLLLAVTNL